MAEYYSYSVLERGIRFRMAVERLSPIGLNILWHDAGNALEDVEISDEPEFLGMVQYTPEVGYTVSNVSLIELVYQMARDKAGRIPQDVIGPQYTHADTLIH